MNLILPPTATGSTLVGWLANPISLSSKGTEGGKREEGANFRSASAFTSFLEGEEAGRPWVKKGGGGLLGGKFLSGDVIATTVLCLIISLM